MALSEPVRSIAQDRSECGVMDDPTPTFSSEAHPNQTCLLSSLYLGAYITQKSLEMPIFAPKLFESYGGKYPRRNKKAEDIWDRESSRCREDDTH